MLLLHLCHSTWHVSRVALHVVLYVRLWHGPSHHINRLAVVHLRHLVRTELACMEPVGQVFLIIVYDGALDDFRLIKNELGVLVLRGIFNEFTTRYEREDQVPVFHAATLDLDHRLGHLISVAECLMGHKLSCKIDELGGIRVVPSLSRKDIMQSTQTVLYTDLYGSREEACAWGRVKDVF
jgi:hypothetical protein